MGNNEGSIRFDDFLRVAIGQSDRRQRSRQAEDGFQAKETPHIPLIHRCIWLQGEYRPYPLKSNAERSDEKSE